MWPGQSALAEYGAGVEVWSPLGFSVREESALVECPRRWYDDGVTNCVITIGVKRERTNTQASRDERYMIIDERTVGEYDLVLAVAHEAGHILGDTAEHTETGVMSGTSARLSDDDRDLMCRSVGLCI